MVHPVWSMSFCASPIGAGGCAWWPAKWCVCAGCPPPPPPSWPGCIPPRHSWRAPAPQRRAAAMTACGTCITPSGSSLASTTGYTAACSSGWRSEHRMREQNANLLTEYCSKCCFLLCLTGCSSWKGGRPASARTTPTDPGKERKISWYKFKGQNYGSKTKVKC